MVFRDLLAILRNDLPYVEIEAEFEQMLTLARAMFTEVNEALWTDSVTAELQKKIRDQDIQVNKLERSIKLRLLQRMAVSGAGTDVGSCFALLSLAKDAERLGDYAKNLSEVPKIDGDLSNESSIRTDLRYLSTSVGDLLERMTEAYTEVDTEAAEKLVREARAICRTADKLLPSIAGSGFDSHATTTATLMTRFYKRIAGHTANILSSVIMPTHKIGYFDERELSQVS